MQRGYALRYVKEDKQEHKMYLNKRVNIIRFLKACDKQEHKMYLNYSYDVQVRSCYIDKQEHKMYLNCKM